MMVGAREGKREDGANGHIRLVATDLDGTLLTPEGTISPAALAAARRLHAHGIALCLATARRWTGAVPHAETIGLPATLILYDGAITRAYPSGEVIACDPLPAETAQAAAELLAASGLRPVVQYGDEEGERLRTTAPNGQPHYAADYFEAYAHQLEVAPLDRLAEGLGRPLRVLVFGPPSRLRKLARELAHLPCTRQIFVGNYDAAELTLFSSTASKGTALAALAARLGVPLAQTFAIGDGINDLSMLRVAGVSVAMGHAPPVVRRAAKLVGGTNAEDGAAAALEAYALPGRG